ncbi:hypothetical protein [Aliarcobacter cryaerophilus]|uniref:Uncharacterized protein n=1 Tax=Arcobacter sp. AZ-2023 TaxID=3074453 RepID=A0AA96I3S0_9BACT|nr:hypothetical protein RJG54_00745 [Arcobacter sp. AZ-2023]
MNTKQTSDDIASLASKILRDKNSSQIAKSLAASAISQTNTNKQTSAEMEKKHLMYLRVISIAIQRIH